MSNLYSSLSSSGDTTVAVLKMAKEILNVIHLSTNYQYFQITKLAPYFGALLIMYYSSTIKTYSSQKYSIKNNLSIWRSHE